MAIGLGLRPAMLGAQANWRADVAVTDVRPAGHSSALAGAVSLLAQQQLGPVTPILSVAATIAGDSVAAAQILMGIGWLPPWTNRAPLDFGAVVTLYGIAAGDRAQSRTGYARQHVLGERAGVWLGGAFSQIERASALASNTLDAGAWIAKGRARFTATVSTTSTNDRDVFAESSFSLDPFAPRVRVADAVGAVEFVGSRFEVEATLGLRTGVTGLDGTRGFGSVTLGWRIARLVRIVVSGGTQLADPLRGTPEWRSLSAGFRVASPRSRTGVPRGRAGPVLLAERELSGRVRIMVYAPTNAASVELVGTLTGWQPVTLVPAEGGAWEVVIDAPPGPHRLQVRVNGGEWRVPSNLTVERGEFGQRYGVVVIA